jgi:hypothetical protein
MTGSHEVSGSIPLCSTIFLAADSGFFFYNLELDFSRTHARCEFSYYFQIESVTHQPATWKTAASFFENQFLKSEGSVLSNEY